MNDLDFLAEEESIQPSNTLPPWKVLIVDDEPDIHIVTEMALRGFSFQQRELTFLNAYSAREAQPILQQHDDIAVIFLDVVMETRDAGLQLVNWIRHELQNIKTRIVLRTGQPGDAPERQVIFDYDISDYKEKSELTAKKLFSLVCSSLRAYQNLHCLLIHQQGMKKVIKASGELFSKKTPAYFIQSVLEEIFILYQSSNTFGHIIADGIAITCNNHELKVLAATGKYQHQQQVDIQKDFGISLNQIVESDNNIVELDNNRLVILLKSDYCDSILLFIHEVNLACCSSEHKSLLHMFVDNVQMAYDNLALNIQNENTQNEINCRIGEAIETRLTEPSLHVKRVVRISEQLGQYYGLSKKEISMLKFASPLHDIGKLFTSENILTKPDKLDEQEWAEMKLHAQQGQQLLANSELELIRIAADVAGNHHEHWDGQGYPNGIAGKDIPVVARITAVAEVFDVLLTQRCYKQPWSLAQVTAFFQQQRGKQFEPAMVDILLEHVEEFIQIRANTQ